MYREPHAFTLEGPSNVDRRQEFTHPDRKLRLALGLDSFLVPGKSGPKSFLTIWDTSEDEQPCNEGEGGFNNILVSRIAKNHGFTVTGPEIYDIFEN
jgi:hypothetical protein